MNKKTDVYVVSTGCQVFLDKKTCVKLNNQTASTVSKTLTAQLQDFAPHFFHSLRTSCTEKTLFIIETANQVEVRLFFFFTGRIYIRQEGGLFIIQPAGGKKW